MGTDSNAAGKFLDPVAIIAQIGVESGAVVADFGCGPGYFCIPFAKAVGDSGKVYALDILPQTLETVSGKAKNMGLTNVEARRANLEKKGGSKLADGCADWVIVKDILFQNKNKETIIAEAYRIAKPGGKVIVVEWGQGDSAIGPQQEIRIPREDLKKMFLDCKFTIGKDIEAGSFHYAFVAAK